jgi:ferredoxin
VKLQINPDVCQGHGRCYDLAPDLFGDDEEGFGQVLGDGIVPSDKEREARLAVANCPERAIELLEETGHDRRRAIRTGLQGPA